MWGRTHSSVHAAQVYRAAAHLRSPSQPPSQPHPHLIRPGKPQRLIKRPPLCTGMQNHRIHTILPAPLHRRFHQHPRQPPPPKLARRINIQNISPPCPCSNHVRRPVHQPQTGPSRHPTVGCHYQPCHVSARLHLRQQPSPKSRGHRVERRLVAIPHVRKHLPPMGNQRSQIIHQSASYRKSIGQAHKGFSFYRAAHLIRNHQRLETPCPTSIGRNVIPPTTNSLSFRTGPIGAVRACPELAEGNLLFAPLQATLFPIHPAAEIVES
jgi:hypothetical protein